MEHMEGASLCYAFVLIWVKFTGRLHGIPIKQSCNQDKTTVISAPAKLENEATVNKNELVKISAASNTQAENRSEYVIYTGGITVSWYLYLFILTYLCSFVF